MRYATVSQSSVTANGPCARQGRAQRRQAYMPPFCAGGRRRLDGANMGGARRWCACHGRQRSSLRLPC